MFEQSVLSPDDAHYSIIGTWIWIDKNTVSIEATDDKRNKFFPEDIGKEPIKYKYQIKIIKLQGIRI